MKRMLPTVLTFVLLALAALPAWAQRAGANDPLAEILVLHTYHERNSRTANLARGLARALGEEGKAEAQMVAYLNADRLGKSPEYPRFLAAALEGVSVMVNAARPRLVIVTDWGALGFWSEQRAQLAPDAPVIYCGIGTPPPSLISAIPDSTGVVEIISVRETLKTAMQMRPQARKLLVLESSASYFAIVKAQLDRDLAGFDGPLEIHRSYQQELSDIEARLRTLDDSWIVLSVGRPEIGGVPVDSATGSRRLSQASPVPVFATWSTWVGHGALGGKVMSSEEQGYEAGRMAVAILKGRAVSELPMSKAETGRFTFDYNVMKRFGIAESLLPPGSILLNKPVGFYEANRQLVWIYGLVTALLAVICGGLAMYAAYRRRMQRRLAAQVNFVESLMEAMPTPVFYKDTRGIYLGCNKALEDFMGIARGKLVGRPVHEVFGKLEADHFKRQDDALLASGGVQIYEFEKDTPNGPRQIRFHKAVYRDATGAVAGLVGVVADITDLRRAEAEVERTRNYLQAIIDSSPSVILGVDADGRIKHINNAGRELCEAPAESLQEALPFMAGLHGMVLQALAEDRVVQPPRITHSAGGRQRVLDVMIYSLRSIGPNEAVLRVDDVTERQRMEEMLVQSEKMMSVGGLAAGMAHEINNPLGGIMQSAQVIQGRLSPGLPANIEAAAKAGVTMEGVNAYLELRGVPELFSGLRDSARRASAIVSNMLEFSRRTNSAWLPAEVNSLVDKALDLCLQDYNLAERYDFRRVDLVRDFDPGNPVVRCSPAQIQQVIFNIVRNAAQALFAEGTPRPAITVSTRQAGDRVTIEVADNGPGMDEATRRKIFEPFFTTKCPGEGTGLGLSVSYFIVKENHGGEIEVESEPGAGTRFIVSLPVEPRRCP